MEKRNHLGLYVYIILGLILVARSTGHVSSLSARKPRQQATPTNLAIGASSSGDLIDASSDLWFGENMGLTGGQYVYKLESALTLVDITLSTCYGPAFDGTIFIFEANPIEDLVAFPLEYSRQDHYCEPGVLQTTMIFRTNSTSKTYYALIQAESRTSLQNYTLKYTTQVVPAAMPLSWGLDRIDQRFLPLDGEYTVQDGARGTYIYVLDTGIRIDHVEFGTRALLGYNFVNNNEDATDCNGHGTHVAAIAAGATVGVAYAATVISVKVLDCNNQGTVVNLVKGIEWVMNDAVANNRKPALVTASIATTSVNADYDNAVLALNTAGIPFIGSAGNAETASCDSSPGSATLVSAAVAVGATDIKDKRFVRSKSGPCTTIWAPGVDIPSADYTGKYAYANRTGTSQSAPFVAGTLAVLLGLNPDLTPDDARNTLIYTSTRGVVQGLSADDKDRFLFVRSVPNVNLPPPPQDNVYLYTIIRYSNLSCNDSTVIQQLTSGLAKSISLPSSAVAVPNCGPAPLYPLIPTDRHGEKQSTNETDVLFQALVSERLADITFNKLVLVLADGTAEQNMGISYEEVVTAPWVVDSKGHTYWGPPRFENSDSSGGLSGGEIAGIVIGSVAGVILIAGVIYFVAVHSRPAPEKRFEGMHGGKEIDEAIEFHDEDRGHGKMREVLSQRIQGGMFSPRGAAEQKRMSEAKSYGDQRSDGALSPTLSQDETAAFSGGDGTAVKVFSMGGEAFAQVLAKVETKKNLVEPRDGPEAGDPSPAPDAAVDPEDLLKSLNAGSGALYQTQDGGEGRNTPPAHEQTQSRQIESPRSPGHLLLLMSPRGHKKDQSP